MRNCHEAVGQLKYRIIIDAVVCFLLCLFTYVILDMSMTQDNEVGDGTTSVTVLAAELLKEVSYHQLSLP